MRLITRACAQLVADPVAVLRWLQPADDGTKAQVKITSTDRADLLLGDSYTVSMTLHTPPGQQEGYPAIGAGRRHRLRAAAYRAQRR